MQPQPYDVALSFTTGGDVAHVVEVTVDASSPVAAVGLAATQTLNRDGRSAFVVAANLTECHAVLNTGGVPA